MEDMSTRDLLIEFERLLTRRIYRDSEELDKMIHQVRKELYKRATV